MRFAGISVAAFAALIVTPALAADMVTKAPPPPPVPTFSWTGFYIGGNLGGDWGRFSDSISIPSTTAFGLTEPSTLFPFTLTDSSILGGGQIGYRWQAAQWVYGIEGEFDGTNLRSAQTAGAITGVLIPGDTFTLKTNWEASVRVSAGYSWDRWLAYVTGGVAFADVEAGASFIPTLAGGIAFPGSAGSETKVLTGGTIGAGLDYALNQKWDLGVEYRYTDYGSANFNNGVVAAIGAGVGGPFVFAPATARAGLSTNQIVGRLNYRF